ncbi:MAG TPA: DUF5682 family protein [Candidatus Xenobia bacterium]
MSRSVLGIRHHGPGSARSLRRALEDLHPDVVLIEGPPEADTVVQYAHLPDMQPPVALLVYDSEKPEHSAFYPFAIFSPEWQAIQYALDNLVPVRFIDLGFGQRMGLKGSRAHEDPLQGLAAAAGYADAERWWEHLVEERQDDATVFDAILQAMTALRPDPLRTDPREAAREATMRQNIRKAEKEGFQRIAIVCGAWHAPALVTSAAASHDAAILKGLPKLRSVATWVPWTYGRLAIDSGYGAGIESPGWYHHLWTHPEDTASIWLARVAELLRSEDLDASPAQTVDAVRLAVALSALRGRPRPGLDEMNDAALAVFCFGQPVPMRLIRERLIVGETLGHVPEETPQVALAQDLARLQKRLRLPPQAELRELDLDLRKDTDRLRSVLLHQLRVLGIPWGQAVTAQGKLGTFHEYWRLRWRPELSVSLVEASRWGNTVPDAATASAQARLAEQGELAQVVQLLQDLLLAGLFAAMPAAVQRLEDLAALSVDVLALMAAVPPLARLVRYGNVRQTDVGAAGHLLEGMRARIFVGLPPACVALAPEAAEAMAQAIRALDEAVSLLDQDTAIWHETLARVVETCQGVGLVAGTAAGILLDARAWTPEEGRRRLGLALSPARTPPEAAAWVEGFLTGRGTLLLHDDGLRSLLDDWVGGLQGEVFTELLPLLRRTFATFSDGERRQLGERMARPRQETKAELWDSQGVALALPYLSRVLSWTND